MNLREIFSTGKIRDVILDTDAFNEVDDQVAIAYLLSYKDRLKVKGFTVAPFAPVHNKKVKDVAEGIVRSREEIEKVLNYIGTDEYNSLIFEGSREFLRNEYTPVESAAADHILKVSQNYNRGNRLYIIAIGAITNVASAILKDETIVDRIAVIWLGGSAHGWWRNREFNMYQDIAAARVVMSSGVPFAQLPCQGVVDHLITTEWELKARISGKNALCDYFVENITDYAASHSKYAAWSKVIWDVAAVAFTVNDNGRYMKTVETSIRLPSYDKDEYAETLDKTMIYAVQVERDAIMTDVFDKISTLM